MIIDILAAIHSYLWIKLSRSPTQKQISVACRICAICSKVMPELHINMRKTLAEFRLQPFHFPTDAVEGKTVTVTCTTTTAVSGVEYRWLKNNKRVSESAKMRLRTFPELTLLIVGPLEASDSGNYTCQATYNGKKDSFSDTLNVLGEYAQTMLVNP